ncbi:MAG: hypothetical protein M1353_12480 [Nitrospirae bacterium]|nr:hypothetical protein [Nitrospirota bacterium]
MGGPGSGRGSDSEVEVTVCDVLMNDKQFKEHISTKAIEAFNASYNFLLDVVKGAISDTYINQKGIIMSRDIPISDRVKAAKVLKEWTLDKVVSDKRELGDGQPQLPWNHKEDLEAIAVEIEAAKEAEKKAKDSGKLVPISAVGGSGV